MVTMRRALKTLFVLQCSRQEIHAWNPLASDGSGGVDATSATPTWHRRALRRNDGWPRRPCRDANEVGHLISICWHLVCRCGLGARQIASRLSSVVNCSTTARSEYRQVKAWYRESSRTASGQVQAYKHQHGGWKCGADAGFSVHHRHGHDEVDRA